MSVADVLGCTLVVNVWDKDPTSADDFIGGVSFSYVTLNFFWLFISHIEYLYILYLLICSCLDKSAIF